MRVQTKVLEQVNWQVVTLFVGLILVATILPRFIHNQFITGSIINATLFIAASTLGTGSAILIGLVPSTVALSSGLLPVALAPMIPFIMLSNTILVLIFGTLRKINYGLAAIVASLIKYLFLYSSVSWVVQLIVQKPVAAKAAAIMMQWPQLVTTLTGATIAFIILKTLRKFK